MKKLLTILALSLIVVCRKEEIVFCPRCTYRCNLYTVTTTPNGWHTEIGPEVIFIPSGSPNAMLKMIADSSYMEYNWETRIKIERNFVCIQ